MKVGDLVWVLGSTHWGGRYRKHTHPGTLIKRAYLAYDSSNNRWDVLVGGKTLQVRQANLSVVKQGDVAP